MKKLSKYFMPSFFRFIVIGAANTIIGYTIFAILTYLLTDRMSYPYMVAAILSNIIAITTAYINYKLFVFKTRGNYISEYLRFYVVYGFSVILGLILLPLCVEGLGINPYISGVLLIIISVVSSFFGHTHYSFRSINY